MMAVVLAALTACEKPDIGDAKSSGSGNVTVTFSPYSMTTRATSDIREAMTKANLMVFNAGTSTKVLDKVRTQTADDADFGTMSLSLATGSYDVLCVGHSSTRSATLAKDKVSFTAYQGRKITDTFWKMLRIDVGEEDQTVQMTLDRATAMFRLVIEDETPASVTHFKFDYKGGSADFNPNNGNGVTNSQQSELRDLNEESTYEIYTFPKDNGKLTVTAYALDANEDIVSQRIFENVPVKAKTITTYKGKFFDGASGTVSGTQIGIGVNDAWEEVNTYTF